MYYVVCRLNVLPIPVETDCPSSVSGGVGEHVCYLDSAPDGNDDLTVCDKECVGGCSGGSQSDCHACRHVFFEGDQGAKCKSECPSPLLLVSRSRICYVH